MGELTHPVNIGKYQCILRIGQGGMGEVFLGVAQGPGGFSKLNVIKRLRTDVAADQGFIEMFLNEARLAGRLNHPNIVQTKEVGVDGDAHFMVMEYLEGQTLFYLLRKLRRGDLGSGSGGVRLSQPGHELSPSPESRPSMSTGQRSFSQVRDASRAMRASQASQGFTLAMHLQIISDVLAGLHYAHEATDFAGHPVNLIHRDVAPSNIFITYEGQVKVLDFGIAKATDSGNATRAGVFKGKVAYMAPEQFLNANIDRRCDIFATGATLWEAAAGTRLWRGLSDVEIFRHLADGHIPPPSTVAPNVHPKLEAICMRALAFDREKRYATADEFRKDLDALIEELGRPTREEFGIVMSEIFATERAQTKSLIETQLRAVRDMTATSGSLPTADGYIAVNSTRGSQIQSAQSVLGPAAGVEGVDTGAFARRKTPLGTIALGLLLLGGAVFAVTFYLTKPPAPVPEATSSTAATSASSVLTAASSVPTNLTLQITATPGNAALFLDDKRLPGNPYEASVPSDASSHRLRVEAPGYRSQTDFVQFAGTTPITLNVDLVAEKTKNPPPWTPPRKNTKPPPESQSQSQSPVQPQPQPSVTVSAPPAKPVPTQKPKAFEIDTSDPYKK